MSDSQLGAVDLMLIEQQNARSRGIGHEVADECGDDQGTAHAEGSSDGGCEGLGGEEPGGDADFGLSQTAQILGQGGHLF